jgi:hypothetical protein
MENKFKEQLMFIFILRIAVNKVFTLNSIYNYIVFIYLWLLLFGLNAFMNLCAEQSCDQTNQLTD